MAPVNTRRPYRSAIRRGDAPRAILAAAAGLFRTKGYLATSIDDIAAAAGVARPTVFAAVGPKPALLKLVVDHATTGDDARIPVAERAWSREALQAADPALSLRLHARNSRRICDRAADLFWAVESAAAADADAAALWAELQEQRRASMRTYARALARKTELRQDVRTITDTLWAMIPALYLRLVRDSGWPPDRFEAWLGETFIQLWLPQTPAARGGQDSSGLPPRPVRRPGATRAEQTDHDP